MDTTSLVIQGAAILVTAALSSAFTLLAARRVFRRRYLPRIQQELDRTLERLGDVVEERVRKGLVDGVKSLPSPELVRRTRDAVTDAAGELVRGGLSSLLGDKPKPKP